MRRLKDPVLAVWAMYICILIIMITTVVILTVNFHPIVEDDVLSINKKPVMVTWTDENGNEIDVYQLYEKGLSGSIYCTIPETIGDDESLCLECRHVYLTAYFENECIYRRHTGESIFYTKSLGDNFIIIPLDEDMKGQTVRFDYELPYYEKNCGIYDSQITVSNSYTIQVLRHKLPILMFSITFLVYGLILIIVDVVFSRKVSKQHDFFYLGFLIIAVALFVLLESKILQFFVFDLKLVQLLKRFIILLLPFPIVGYSALIYGFKWKKTPLTFCLYSVISFAIMFGYNIYGIYDLHESNFWSCLNIMFAVILTLYAIIRHAYIQNKLGIKATFYTYCITFGIITVALSVSLDLYRYTRAGTNGNLKYTALGFFIFMVCLSISSARKIFDVFETNTKMKLISRLAYKDGLTDLWNRTSYNEDLREIEEKRIMTGVVMLDINNLKFVNDNMGHDNGDMMLRYASSIITDAFCDPAMKCYRIGGDEFAVLIQSADTDMLFDAAYSKMKELYQQFNQTTDLHFKIIIACGYCKFDPSNKEVTLEEAKNTADKRMYVEKKKLKEFRYVNIMV